MQPKSYIFAFLMDEVEQYLCTVDWWVPKANPLFSPWKRQLQKVRRTVGLGSML